MTDVEVTVFLTLFAAIFLAGGGFLLRGTGSPVHRRIARRLEKIGHESNGAAFESIAVLRSRRYPVALLWFQRKLVLAQISVNLRLLSIFAVLALTAVATCAAALSIRHAAVLLALIAMAIFVFVNARAVRNRRRFLELLPSFIERLHQLLGAGNSLVTAFEKALNYSEPLVHAYLQPVAVRLSHGGTLAESLSLQGYRLGLPQLTVLSVVAHANARFGGNLGEVLSRVVTTLIDRQRVQREFDAMTAEMRVSAKILVFLPVAVSAFVLMMNPAYLKFFTEEPMGHSLATAAIGMAALGMLVLRVMSRIEA
jgi:tight adherence protein B